MRAFPIPSPILLSMLQHVRMCIVYCACAVHSNGQKEAGCKKSDAGTDEDQQIVALSTRRSISPCYY